MTMSSPFWDANWPSAAPMGPSFPTGRANKKISDGNRGGSRAETRMSAEKDLLDTITEELDNTHGPAIDISPEMEAAILGDDAPMEPVPVVKPTPVGRAVLATAKKASKPNPSKQNRV